MWLPGDPSDEEAILCVWPVPSPAPVVSGRKGRGEGGGREEMEGMR